MLLAEKRGEFSFQQHSYAEDFEADEGKPGARRKRGQQGQKAQDNQQNSQSFFEDFSHLPTAVLTYA